MQLPDERPVSYTHLGEKEGKEVTLLNVPYANSFSDAPKGKEFATELIAQGRCV